MKRYFIPCKENKFHPLLLRKAALSVYLILLILINFIFGGLSLVYTKAAIDFDSLYRLHNEERATRGLPALTVNPKLINSAAAKAEAMLDSNCWSHYCPDGKSPWEFFDAVSYNYVYAGENLAEGFVTNEALMTAWMNSPTHRENVLNGKFNEVGIGYAIGDYQGIKNNTVIVVHFGNLTNNIVEPEAITTKPETSNAEELVITNPKDGGYYKDQNFEISGTVSGPELVELKANDNSLGQVPVSGGNFSYRPNALQMNNDGTYKISAQATAGKTQLSDVVNIVIDSKPPVIKSEQIKFENLQNKVQITVNFANVEQVSISNLNLDLTRSNNDTWTAVLSDYDPAQTPSLVFAASDKAGNIGTLEIRPQNLAAVKSANSETVSDNAIVIFKNPASAVNFAILVFLSGLFGIDFMTLHKQGMTSENRSHSHLNFILFVFLALILLFGSASGDILKGFTI